MASFNDPIPKIITPWAEKTPFQKLEWYYNQYSMSLCLSMLEPWERRTFNFFFLIVILSVCYTAVVYVPIHLYSMWSLIQRGFSDLVIGGAGKAEL